MESLQFSKKPIFILFILFILSKSYASTQALPAIDLTASLGQLRPTFMGKALIIAEKPSVAADIAKALGGFVKKDDLFESDQYVLSSAVGHLLELCLPEDAEVKRGKWSFAHLPVIPSHFDLRPIEKSAPRLGLLLRVIKRKDVDRLINACDAGREGELIFRNIVRHANARQPIQRLWLQSMTPASIREGFAALREDASMRPLADAAVCRSESDWLVGINGTRAMTAFNSKTGGFHLTTVGRVQTPTLAIVVEREEKIKNFVPRDYCELHATFAAQAGEYAGRWFDPEFSRAKKDNDPDLKPERIWDRAKAEAIRQKCLGKPGVVTEESKPASQLSPLLYDLTSLQRDANSRIGFSAKNTLGLAQGLYERHKVLTYPRTDARALPEDYIPTVKSTLQMLGGTAYARFAAEILQKQWVRPDKRIFNNAKISDHFAIIPTSLAPKNLNEAEQKLYDMVARRFLAVFYPAAEFLLSTRITRVLEEAFKTEGKVMLQAGWMSVYGKEVQTEDQSPRLVPVQPNEIVRTEKIEVVATQTKPPARYTEATLLSAMEGAGKLVEDEELREAMSQKGLGTPATRAAIIEGLLYEKYLLRNLRELQPTPKAFSLITLLRGLEIPELSSPELTGDWEFKLRQMERGQLGRPEFMREIQDMTRNIVAKAKGHESDTVPGDFGQLQTPCPKCGAVIKENYKKFQCQKCDFSLWKIVAGRQMEISEVDELITKRVLGPLQGFRSKTGRPFAAIIKLNPEFKPEFDFGQQDEQSAAAAAALDFTGREPVGKCPSCGAPVYEEGMNYICEKNARRQGCAFRTGKVILQRPIEREQVQKLLATGRTGLLDKFISKKGRPFKAFLVVGPEGKVGFEFEPRQARPSGPSKPREAAPKEDLTGAEPVATCPVCGGRVLETATHYICERSQAEKKPCKFKTARTIAGQPLDRQQLQKLLTDGRTDLLTHFVSKRGLPFSACLVMGEDHKITFDFPS
jgi:DNA topoisomerase-3